jgi:hypothetical protein
VLPSFLEMTAFGSALLRFTSNHDAITYSVDKTAKRTLSGHFSPRAEVDQA